MMECWRCYRQASPYPGFMAMAVAILYCGRRDFYIYYCPHTYGLNPLKKTKKTADLLSSITRSKRVRSKYELMQIHLEYFLHLQLIDSDRFNFTLLYDFCIVMIIRLHDLSSCKSSPLSGNASVF